jgi:hypothetical protein
MPMKKAQAYVLLDVSIASENRVLAELIKVEGLDEAYLLRDVHDMILLAGADNTKELLSLVNGKIKAISGIRSAIVLVIKVA